MLVIEMQAKKHFLQCCLGVGALVVAVFLVAINRIYLHHNLERLIHAEFLVSSVCEIRGGSQVLSMAVVI